MSDKQIYISRLRRSFPLYGRKERNFIKELKSQIEENYEDINISYKDIVNDFGSPKDVMLSYYENVDESALIRRLSIVKSIRTIVLVSLVILLSLLAIITYDNHQMKEHIEEYMITQEEEVIGEEIIEEENK